MAYPYPDFCLCAFFFLGGGYAPESPPAPGRLLRALVLGTRLKFSDNTDSTSRGEL